MPDRTPGSDSLIIGGAVFTHNIELPGIGETAPFHHLVAGNGICRAAMRDLKLCFPGIPRDLVSVADLGCLEGGYSAAFAAAGYDVTGMDARPENIACCEFVARTLNLANLRFIQGDVRDIFSGEISYDAVFCCGLLYHMDRPAAFLRQLGAATQRLLIVQTHYSTRPDSVHEGYAGHWYHEGAGREASWGNTRSFWLTRRHLMAAIRAAGFDLVFEQADYKADLMSEGYEGPDERGMFLGIKTSYGN